MSMFLINTSSTASVDAMGQTEVSPTLTPVQLQDLESMNFWINAVVTNIIVLLGLIGNMLTIIILSQRAMRSSTNHYLCALAVWDSIVLIGTGLLIGLPAIPQLAYYRSHVYAYVVSYIYPFALIAQTATIWLTVSFTVERYIAVCHPLKAASMCTITRAKIVIFAVALGATLYNIPRWFDYHPVLNYDQSKNTTAMVPARTLFGQHPTYLEVYFSWLYVPIMCIIPVLVLSLLNLFLIRAVRRSSNQRKTMNVKQSRENNVTIMLVTVVIVFIICQVPALVYNTAVAIDMVYVENTFAWKVISVIRNFLVNFNSAVNFLLYCALGQKFRNIFLHTFCWRCMGFRRYRLMSGVHNPTIALSMQNKKGVYNYKSRNFTRNQNTVEKNKLPLANRHSINQSQTSQESALLATEASTPKPAMFGTNNAYNTAPPKAKRNEFHRSSDFIDSSSPDGEDTGSDRPLCEEETDSQSQERSSATTTLQSSPPVWLNGKPLLV